MFRRGLVSCLAVVAACAVQGVTRGAAAAVPVLPAPSSPSDVAPAEVVRALSLEQALALAERHHTRLAAARHRVTAARGAIDVARAANRPSVLAAAEVVGATANNTTATQFGVAGLDLPRVGATPVQSPEWAPHATTFVAASLRQRLFDSGRVAAETARLRAEAAASGFDAEAAKLDVRLAVREAFYAVLAAKAVYEAAREAESRARAYLDYARAAVAQGLRASSDLLRAESEAAIYTAGRVRANAGVRLAQTVLANAIQSGEVRVDAREASGTAGAQASLLAVPAEPSVTGAHPLTRAARARWEAQRAATRAAAREGLPELYASASVSGRAGGAEPSSGDSHRFDGWLPTVPNYGVGVILRVPVLDPTSRARERASRLAETARRSELRHVTREQLSELREARLRLLSIEESLPALRASAEAARGMLRDIEARYRAGLTTSLELADAEARRVEAEIGVSIAEFEARRAEARLLRAMGR